MLRVLFSAIMVILLSPCVYAQINWVEHPIDTLYDGAIGVYALDMDGDNDIDIVSVAYDTGNDLSWWENDGSQLFTRHVIDGYVYGGHGVYADDINMDGDIDVVCAASLSDEILMYDNDGNMNFTEYNITANYDGAGFAHISDVDSDNDNDIVACAIFDGILSWFENDGYPNFTRHDIDTSFSGCRFVHACDLDIDGDTDIIGAGTSLGELAWYENDGNQAFQKNVITWFYYVSWARPFDFDNDGDTDILSCGEYDDDISWWENVGNMIFIRHPIDAGINGPVVVEAADIDLDGDLDILGAVRHLDEISWWGNHNNTNFTKFTIRDNYDYAATVYPVDIDRDGDIDVIGGAFAGDELTWWENHYIFVPGYVVGVVTNDEAIPIESVYVHSDIPYGGDYTDNGGYYELELPEGTYDIIFENPRYFDFTVPDVVVETYDTTTVNAMLTEMPYACSSCVKGFVVNRESAEIESVYVSAVGTNVRDYTSLIGWYRLVGLPAGIYDISFSHANYRDTIIADVAVDSDSGITLDIVMESNSAITGVVMDTSSQPIEDAIITVLGLELADTTNSFGEYFIQGMVPGYTYDILFSNDHYVRRTLHGIIFGANDTITLDTMYLVPGIFVWYGNPDGSPLIAPIGETLFVDIYFQSADSLNMNFLHLPLGTLDQYIVDHHSVTAGVLYYPLDEWDEVEFYPPEELSPGWHNQSLLGFADLGGNPNPYLHFSQPTRIASFAFETVNDTTIIGDTVLCLAEGNNMANGGPLIGDSTGVIPYLPFQYFSPLHFVEPTVSGCEYVVGDANNSGDFNGLDITFGVNYFKGGPQPATSGTSPAMSMATAITTVWI
jgi:hypothetical protein